MADDAGGADGTAGDVSAKDAVLERLLDGIVGWALLFQRNVGVQNQAVQIASRLGWYDPAALRGAERVFASVAEMVDAQEHAGR